MITHFDGDVGALRHLEYDITNVVHPLRPDSDVLVVGFGGGRDVLSALAFGQKTVVGVEMNPDIIDVVTRVFGDFTGHLDRHPNVTLVNDEVRSYLSRIDERFGVIQISGMVTFNMRAVSTLVLLLVLVVALCGLCVLLPLVLTLRRPGVRGGTPFFVFFAGIGLGFMFIETGLDAEGAKAAEARGVESGHTR